MGEEQGALHELCRRVAEGDPDARMEFSREVAPLVEVIARRWLSKANQRRSAAEETESGLFDEAASCNTAQPVGEATVASVAVRICRSLIEKIGKQRSHPAAETLVQRLPWPTELGALAD